MVNGITYPEYLAEKYVLKEKYFNSAINYCKYNMEMGYLHWKTGYFLKAREHYLINNIQCDDKKNTSLKIVESDILAGDYTSAYMNLNEFSKMGVLDSGIYIKYMPAIQDGLQLIGAFSNPKKHESEQHSKNMARFLANIPGLGHFYLGETKRGLHYFIVNTLLISILSWRGYEIIEGENRNVRMSAVMDLSLLGILILPRYFLGSKKTAYDKAKEINNKPIRLRIEKFKQKILDKD